MINRVVWSNSHRAVQVLLSLVGCVAAVGAAPDASNGIDSLEKATLPVVTIGTPIPTLMNSAGTASFPITITDASTINLTPGDVTINHAGPVSGGVVNVLDGSTANPTVEVSGITGGPAGNFTISIAAGVASDLSANLSAAAGPSDIVFIDNVAPTITIGSPTGAPVNSNGELSYPVSILGANTINLTPADVSVAYEGSAAGGSISVLNGNTLSASVLLTGFTGNGDVTISIAAGVASDSAGNQTPAVGPSFSARVDNTAPVFSSVNASPPLAGVDDVVSLSFAASEFIAGDATVTVNGNPAVRVAKGAPFYGYEYTVLPTDPPGPAIILITGLDNAGNPGLLSNSTSLSIESIPAPAVPLAFWPAGIALLGAGILALRGNHLLDSNKRENAEN